MNLFFKQSLLLAPSVENFQGNTILKKIKISPRTCHMSPSYLVRHKFYKNCDKQSSEMANQVHINCRNMIAVDRLCQLWH